MCVCGEIGKHNRLKICRPQGLAGSSPARRTTPNLNNKINALLGHDPDYRIRVTNCSQWVFYWG